MTNDSGCVDKTTPMSAVMGRQSDSVVTDAPVTELVQIVPLVGLVLVPIHVQRQRLVLEQGISEQFRLSMVMVANYCAKRERTIENPTVQIEPAPVKSTYLVSVYA